MSTTSLTAANPVTLPSTPFGDNRESHFILISFRFSVASLNAFSSSRSRVTSSKYNLFCWKYSVTSTTWSLSSSIRIAAATISVFSDSYVVCLPMRIARVRNFKSRSSSIVPMRASSAPVARRCSCLAHCSMASLSLSAMESSPSNALIRVRAALPFATRAWQRARRSSTMGL